jgi:hypothetical protein
MGKMRILSRAVEATNQVCNQHPTQPRFSGKLLFGKSHHNPPSLSKNLIPLLLPKAVQPMTSLAFSPCISKPQLIIFQVSEKHLALIADLHCHIWGVGEGIQGIHQRTAI